MWAGLRRWIAEPSAGRSALVAAASRVLLVGAALWLTADATRREPPSAFLLHGGRPHPNRAVDVFQRWDAYWMLNIARNGYRYRGVQEQLSGVEVLAEETNITPFPGYPAAIWLLHALVGDLSLAALLVSWTCFFALVVLLHRHLSARHGPAVAGRAVAYLCCYPTSFIFTAPYSESLFLLAAVVSVEAARRDQPLRAGIAGLVASATRLAGAFLAPCLLLELARGAAGGSRGRGLRRGLLAAALTCCGFVGYFIFLYLLTGDPEAYFTAQQGWHKSLVAPWAGLAALVGGAVEGGQMAGLQLCCALLFAAAAIWGTRRLPAGAVLLLWCWWLMPLCSSNLLGLPRYLMVAFPAFAAFGVWGERRWVHGVLLATFSALQLLVLRRWLLWEISL